MRDIEESTHDWNCLVKRNVTDDKRFGELVQQNDDSGKNDQLDIFIFQHFFVSKGSKVHRSKVQRSGGIVKWLISLLVNWSEDLIYFKLFDHSTI